MGLWEVGVEEVQMSADECSEDIYGGGEAAPAGFPAV